MHDDSFLSKEATNTLDNGEEVFCCCVSINSLSWWNIRYALIYSESHVHNLIFSYFKGINHLTSLLLLSCTILLWNDGPQVHLGTPGVQPVNGGLCMCIDTHNNLIISFCTLLHLRFQRTLQMFQLNFVTILLKR